jgi:tripartite-type tricarboxylate transporter receptor subunit TctC
MTLGRRQILRLVGAAATLPFAPQVARTQAWPAAKTIRLIVPFSAGSTVDVVGRLLIAPLSQQLGQTVILQNWEGGGASMVASADPDGYTILVNTSAHSAIPAIYANVPYDTVRDFAAVTSLGSSPNVLVISPKSGFKTLKDLVTAGKSRSGGLTYATAGVGSATHLSTERLRVAAGFEAVHVPFQGMPEAIDEVMTGRVDFCCASVALAVPLIHSGELIALSVTTPKRSPALPDVPTSIESGYPNSDYTFWLGMFLPAKTPREIVDRLHHEVQKAMQSGMAERLAKIGIDPMPITPQAFDALKKKEIAENIALVKAAGIKVY